MLTVTCGSVSRRILPTNYSKEWMATYVMLALLVLETNLFHCQIDVVL